MAQRIPFVQVVLIFSLAILILSELVSTQEDCAAHANYCNDDPAVDDVILCCDGEKCVKTQSGSSCDCAPDNASCDSLPCCKGLVCWGSGHCGEPCAPLGGGCETTPCCEDLWCTGCNGDDCGDINRCKPKGGRTNGTTGTNGRSNNGRTNGF